MLVKKVYGSKSLDRKSLHEKFKKIKTNIMNCIVPNFNADPKNVGSDKGLSDALDAAVQRSFPSTRRRIL